MVFPATVLQGEIEALLGYLPQVRDGDVEGVHGARVMTRKLREVLPLFARSFPVDVLRVKRIVKQTGRRLGRVRELDVMEADLTRRAGRMPLAQHAISAAKAMLDAPPRGGEAPPGQDARRSSARPREPTSSPAPPRLVAPV